MYKFAIGGKDPLLTFGEKLKPGIDDEHFCKPTDVTTLKDGTIFVTDGYGDDLTSIFIISLCVNTVTSLIGNISDT